MALIGQSENKLFFVVVINLRDKSPNALFLNCAKLSFNSSQSTVCATNKKKKILVPILETTKRNPIPALTPQ